MKKGFIVISCFLALVIAVCGATWLSHFFIQQQTTSVTSRNTSLKYRRILAISPALQEIVMALAQPEQIVAVSPSSKNSPIPEIAQGARKVKGEVSEHPSTEEIVALRPDIILIPVVFSREQADILTDMKLNVVSLGVPNSYSELKDRILRIAEKLGLSEKGRELTGRMDQKLALIQEKNKAIQTPKLVIAYSVNGAFGRKNGSFDNICREAGAINGGGVVNLKRGEHLSKEQVIQLDPDVILCARSLKDSKLHQDILYDPAFQNIKAVKNHQVFLIEDRHLSSVTQSFVDAVEAVSRLVYPELWE
ncbi:MAG: ABC transporter substrate-binding protein [Negativicutes bacterium]